MGDRQVEYRKTCSLKPHPNNVRKHPGGQIRRLMQSIEQFGFTSPPLIDENNVTLGGAARVLAATKIGLPEIPVIVLRGLSDLQKRAYVLADNKIAEMSGYDQTALAVELQDLAALLAKEGLALSLTGFNAAEIDALMVDHIDPERDPGDNVPAIAGKVCFIWSLS